jgi:hypothetical protein
VGQSGGWSLVADERERERELERERVMSGPGTKKENSKLEISNLY